MRTHNNTLGVVKENMVVSKLGDQEYCYWSSIIEACSKWEDKPCYFLY